MSTNNEIAKSTLNGEYGKYQDTDSVKVQNSSFYGQLVNPETGEIATSEIVVSETADYKVVKLADGTFKKNVKYHAFQSRTPETEEEQIELYQVFNDSTSKLVTPLKNMIDQEITMQHVFIQPYESFNEGTGDVTPGVTCTIQSVDGTYYATSSKSVYHKLRGLFQAFGNPSHENFKPLKLKVTGTKQKNGVQIDLQLIGRA